MTDVVGMPDDETYIKQALAGAERIKDELLELDELIQIYQKVEKVVQANSEIQTNNGLFFAFQKTHTDSLLIRLRRLVDDNRRTGSLYRLARHIADRPMAFSWEWFAKIYADTVVVDRAANWWREYSDPNSAHVCPIKLMAKADDLRIKARGVSDWVSQNIAHLDKNQTVPMPKWGDYYSALDEVRSFFTWMYTLLTGCSLEPHLTIAVDWEESLMIPWMPMSTRIKRIREIRAQKKQREVSNSPLPPHA